MPIVKSKIPITSRESKPIPKIIMGVYSKEDDKNAITIDSDKRSNPKAS